MPQSSLMAWLNKPKAMRDAPVLDEASHEPPFHAPIPPQSKDGKVAVSSGDGPKTSVKPAFGSTQKSLPPNVELRSCMKEDIPNLKRLTGLLLPIPYPEKFYLEITKDPVISNITQLAVWHDDPAIAGKDKGRLVGAIRCKLLAHHSTPNSKTIKDESPMLYLSTLVLLSPYRSHGIATHLLHSLTKRAIDDYGISSIGAHVWEANIEALDWYRKRGFREVGRESGYYRRLDPQGAVVMQREVGVMDLVGG